LRAGARPVTIAAGTDPAEPGGTGDPAHEISNDETNEHD